MSRLYGQVITDASQTGAHRRGNKDIKVVAQSYVGSVSVRMYVDEHDEIQIEIGLGEGSTTYTNRILYAKSLAHIMRGGLT
jgi:hypothetical protein